MSLLVWLNDFAYDGLPYVPAVISFVITFRYLNFPDLTAAGSFIFGAAVGALAVVKFGVEPHVALLLAFSAGALAGGVTAFFNVVLRIEKLLAGILAAFLLYAVNQLLLSPTLPYGRYSTVLTWAELRDRQIGAGYVAWHPWAIAVFLILALASKFMLDWLFHSEVGLNLRALEDSDAGDDVLRRNGISPERYRAWGIVVANALVGLSGAVIGMREGAANANRGFDLLVTGIVAYLVGAQLYVLLGRLGKTLPWMRRIEPTSAALLGTLSYFALVDLAQQIQVSQQLTQIVLVLLIVVSLGRVPSVQWSIWRRAQRTTTRSEFRTEPQLELDRVSFKYPSTDEDAVRNESLVVEKGERLLLKGANGSGKTTIMKIASGLLAPSSGEIRLAGKDVTANSSARLRSAVYVDQDAHRGVVGTLTVEENLALARNGSAPSLWRRAVGRTTVHSLKLVKEFAGFPESHLRKTADALSGGQRQIINLLTLLARRKSPEIVLMDEPTNNLDSEHTARCREIIEELRKRGVSVVLVSHSGLDTLPVDRTLHLPTQAFR